MKRGKKSEHANDDMRAIFGMWLGLPLNARAEDERTQDMFEKKYSVSGKTLSQWKKEPQVHAIANTAVKTFFQKDTFEVIQKMMELAKAGDPKARRDYLEWQGELGTRTKDARSPVINVTLKRDDD